MKTYNIKKPLLPTITTTYHITFFVVQARKMTLVVLTQCLIMIHNITEKWLMKHKSLNKMMQIII